MSGQPEQRATEKVAVVLFTMGGPDRLESVRPFLFNLFNDPAILRLPAVPRRFLAWLISSRRAKPATEIYRLLGGSSPLLKNTEAQAAALEAALGAPERIRTFVAMRYWHPFAGSVVPAVKAFDPDRIVLLPLYPQWSTTTSASSVADWERACRKAGLDKPTRTICCYPTEPGLIEALTGLIRPLYRAAANHGRTRVLFSAHGLPEKIVAAGDPYQWQCERTAEALVAALGIANLDWVSCYQSRVGPMTWIGPETAAEIARAGREGVAVVVVPIAFVSEHSETLVELDIEYRHLAERSGVPAYLRVPTVGIEPAFIAGLARLVGDGAGDRRCPGIWSGCARKGE
ncbi:MAG: ferrochelatase [Rhodospirillaceae bacterium]